MSVQTGHRASARALGVAVPSSFWQRRGGSLLAAGGRWGERAGGATWAVARFVSAGVGVPRAEVPSVSLPAQGALGLLRACHPADGHQLTLGKRSVYTTRTQLGWTSEDSGFR